MCVVILTSLNIKIKLPLYKTDSEWGESLWRVENVSDYIESYPTFGRQL